VQYPKLTGPDLVVSQGKSGQSKQSLTPFLLAHAAIMHIPFSFGVQPNWPFGQVFLAILGHRSHDMPHTPTFKLPPFDSGPG
jgi:hypothetical protein